MPKIKQKSEKLNIDFNQLLKNKTAIPVKEDTPIIRYMGLSKFYSLITSKTIWFPRLDQFSDENEGLAFVDTNKISTEEKEYFQKSALASCWNEYKDESFPLWKIYLGNEPGVAIISTVGKFLESVKENRGVRNIQPLKVQYISPTLKDNVYTIESFTTRKHSFYKYEEEIRFIYYSKYYQSEGKSLPIGKAFKIDPRKLISQIIISPYLPNWNYQAFKKIIGKFGFGDININPSIVKDTMLKNK